ncbi:thermonuclease family protein [Fontimonas sp. SYSU GA230001]|uniref:thermonuclease family protein n=1 Tax=Fontimonas sp. SYSU GA230001 TaxID=3142450 RepID=UPI0032B32BBF
MRTPLLAALLAATAALGDARADAGGPALAGVATVIDGDTIEIHGRRIRLHGIDAPEAGQTCRRQSDGQVWPCGRRAAQALQALLGRRTVECIPGKTDRYGRLNARCSVGGVDIEAWMVRQGWALAYRRYSQDYVDEEAQARGARRNIWSGTMQNPERYRRDQATARRSRAVTDCERTPRQSSASAPGRTPAAENGCARN